MSAADPQSLSPPPRTKTTAKPPPRHPDDEPPRMMTSRPPDTVRGASLSWQETQFLASRVSSKVHRINLGKMHDNVVLADKRGNIDERMYDDLISFFFSFVPMVLNTQPRDPCVATGSELLVYKDLMAMFEDTPDRKNERVVRGEGRVHEWYTRPKNKKALLGKLLGR